MKPKPYKPTPLSPALQIITDFCREEGRHLGRSNLRRDQAKRAIVTLCIAHGVHFDLIDFRRLTWPIFGHGLDGDGKVDAEFCNRAGVPHYHPTEDDYALACGCRRGHGNSSAVSAFERWKDRKPFLILPDDSGTKQRIYVGYRFRWNRDQVECTSFAEDQQSLIAVLRLQADLDAPARVARRLRISHADLAAHNKSVTVAKRVVTAITEARS